MQLREGIAPSHFCTQKQVKGVIIMFTSIVLFFYGIHLLIKYLVNGLQSKIIRLA